MKLVNFEGGQCKRIRSYLDSYLSNELMVETNLEVLKHLESCEDCSRALDDRARVKAQLKQAVRSVQAPETLGDRIRVDIRRTRRPSFNLNTSWMVAAAAAVVLAVALGVFFRSGSNPPVTGSRPLSMIAEVAPEDVAGQILKVGFDDHVYCAIDHGMANKRFTAEQMSEKLGPTYESLIPLVKERMPQGFDVVVGHRCHYQNREFVHLILRTQQEVVSLIVTQKNGEAFPADDVAVMNSAGFRIHEASWHNLKVAGFETTHHLVFVISDGTNGDNQRIASSLIPAVSDFLRSVET